MNSRYKRLIELAEEVDSPFGQSKLLELNELLVSFSVNEMQPEHLQMLDGLITTMLNTGSVLEKYEVKMDDLLEAIRSLRFN